MKRGGAYAGDFVSHSNVLVQIYCPMQNSCVSRDTEESFLCTGTSYKAAGIEALYLSSFLGHHKEWTLLTVMVQ